MGQARNRGTFEERKAEAIAKAEKAQQERDEARRQHHLAELKNPRPRGRSSALLLGAAVSAAMGASFRASES